MQMMQHMIPYNMALLAIAAIFYSWRDVYLPFAAQYRALDREQQRERAAHLLWAAANGSNPDGSSLSDAPE